MYARVVRAFGNLLHDILSCVLLILENGTLTHFRLCKFAEFHEGREEMRTNRKHKVLTFTFDEWGKIEKLAARCNMKTATFIKTSALKGKVFVIDLKENHDYVVVRLTSIAYQKSTDFC